MMRNEQLEQQLAAYAEFLDEVSRDRRPDLTPKPAETQGDVTVVDLMSKTETKADTGQPRWGGRTMWLVATAAVVSLIAAIALLLPGGEDASLETIETPEVEAEQEELEVTPEPAETGGLEAEPAIGERLEEAASLESSALLAGLYSSQVAVSVEGFEFDIGAGIDFPTDMGMAHLIDVRFTNCVQSDVTTGESTMVCDWSLDFTMLDGTVPPQTGTAMMSVVDDEITSVDMTSDDIEGAASDLALYRGWVEANGRPAEEMFTPWGTISISTAVAPLHQTAAADFLEATDLEADLGNIGNVLTAAVRAGDIPTARRVFTADAAWIEPVLKVDGDTFIERVLGSNAFTQVALFNFDDCAAASEVTCAFVIDYPLIPGLAQQTGTGAIAMEGQQIASVTLSFAEPDRSQYLASHESYQRWVAETHGTLLPNLVDQMFIGQTLLAADDQAIDLHRDLGKEWSDSLGG